MVCVMSSLPLSAWASFRPATCLPDDCFCEAIHAGLVRQPANTWSSLAFVAVAVWVAFRQRTRVSGRPSPLPGAEGVLLAVSMLLVGLGSAFYHASLTFVGQVVDVSGMYFIATFILLHRLAPRWRLSASLSVLAFVGVNASLMAAQIAVPSLRRVAFGVLLASALVVEWRASRAGRPWLVLGAGLMVAAFAIWVLDLRRIACAPESFLQGHALWHLLGAAAAMALFRSYEVESPAVDPASDSSPRVKP